MNPLDAAASSDNRISMEGLKALLAANAVACAANSARIAFLCVAPSITTSTSTLELRTAQTVDATTAADMRDDGNHSDLDGTVATLPAPVASLLLHSASEISLPLHAALEFQPLTPTRCSTQCSPDDAGVVMSAFGRDTSPSTTFGSSCRPLQLDGDQDNRCIEANGESRAYVSALDSPSSSSHTANPMNTSKLDVDLPTKCATMGLDHNIGRNLAAATLPCTGCVPVAPGGATPTPARPPATVLELDKLTSIRCLLLRSGADTFDDIIKLDATTSDWTILVTAFSIVTTNSNACGEELRPLPWPSFMHSQEEGPLSLPPTQALALQVCNAYHSLEAWFGCHISGTSMSEQMWLTIGDDTSYETRWDPGGWCFSAWIRQWQLLLIISKGSLVKIHLQEPWPPLQGMYMMPHMGEPHHGFYCYAINFDLQGTSPSAGIYSPAIDEKYCFSCKLFTIETTGKFWPCGQISFTMDFLITQCKQYVPLWQSLSFISGCWLTTRGKVMAMELLATPRKSCVSWDSCDSYLRSTHGPACACIDSCLAEKAENCWCYPFWAKTCTTLEANLKCYLETLGSMVPYSGRLGLGAQVQQEPNDDDLSSWSSFLNNHLNCSNGKKSEVSAACNQSNLYLP